MDTKIFVMEKVSRGEDPRAANFGFPGEAPIYYQERSPVGEKALELTSLELTQFGQKLKTTKKFDWKRALPIFLLAPLAACGGQIDDFAGDKGAVDGDYSAEELRDLIGSGAKDFTGVNLIDEWENIDVFGAIPEGVQINAKVSQAVVIDANVTVDLTNVTFEVAELGDLTFDALPENVSGIDVVLEAGSSFSLVADDLPSVQSITGTGRVYISTSFADGVAETNEGSPFEVAIALTGDTSEIEFDLPEDDNDTLFLTGSIDLGGGTLIVDSGNVDITGGEITGVGKLIVNSGLTLSVEQLLRLTPDEIALEIETQGSGRINIEIESVADANALQGALEKLNFVEEVPTVTVEVAEEAKGVEGAAEEIDAALQTAAVSISSSENLTFAPTILKASGDVIQLAPGLKILDGDSEVQLLVEGSGDDAGVSLRIYLPTINPPVEGDSVEVSWKTKTGDPQSKAVELTENATSTAENGLLYIDVEIPGIDLPEGDYAIKATVVSGENGEALYRSNAVKYAYDLTPPSVEVSSSGDGALKSLEAETLTFTFSEKVFGLTSDDFLATHGELSNLSRSADGKSWTIKFTAQDDYNGPGSVELLAGSIADRAGNSLTDAGSVEFVIENVNDQPTGSVTIAGTAQEDQTLTAVSTIDDKDGLGELSLQWLADGVAIDGATASTLTLGQAEVGKAVSVTASYTDALGTEESVESSATVAVQNVNDRPTGTVTIEGDAREDQTLTAVSTLADEDGLGDLSYQWFADGVAIEGATGSTLTLGQAEVGKAVSVSVSYTDGEGTNESVTSEATAAVSNVNDDPTGGVTISGSAAQNETLSADTSGLADEDGLGALSYKWFADDAQIQDATSDTLVLTQGQVGAEIRVEVSYIDGYGESEVVSSAATVAVENANDAPNGGITIEGTASQANTLSISADLLGDEDGLGEFSYTWLRDGVEIDGANAANYVLEEEDVGAIISAKVEYTDGYGQTEVVTSPNTAPVTNKNDAPTGDVTIAGVAREDETLSAISTLDDADGLGELSYQWLANGVAIDGATAETLTLGQGEVGKAISANVKYTDGNGTLESVQSDPTAAVENVNDFPFAELTISGTPEEGQTLTAVHEISDEDGVGDLSYQWLADGVAVEGATGSTLTLGQAEVGKAVSVSVSYTDGEGTNESVTSEATAAVSNVNDDPAGTVTIEGDAREDQTLTAVSTLADEDGLGDLSYQWLADGVAVEGATGSTLTLGQAEVGKAVSVSVSYTDGEGTNESVTSEATAAVSNVNDDPTGGVSISGIVMENETLSADTSSLADEDGLGVLSYQWFADGTQIPNATADTLTLTQGEVGKPITLEVRYDDAFGNEEIVVSDATVGVVNYNDPPEMTIPTSVYFMPNDQDVRQLNGISTSATGSYTRNYPFEVSDADGDDILIELLLLDAPDTPGMPEDIGLYLDKIGGYSPVDDTAKRQLEFGGSGGSDTFEFHLDYALVDFQQIYDALEFTGSVSYDFRIQVSDYVNVFDSYDFSIVFEKPWPFGDDDTLCTINMDQYDTFVAFRGGATLIDPTDLSTVPSGVGRFVSDPVERDGAQASPGTLELQYVSTIADFANAVGSLTAMGVTLIDFDSDAFAAGNFAGTSTAASYVAEAGTTHASNVGAMWNGSADGTLIVDGVMSINLFNTGDSINPEGSVDDPGIATNPGNDADRGFNMTVGGDQYLEILPGEDTSGGVMLCFDQTETPVYGFGFDLMGREETKRDVMLDIHLSDGTIIREVTGTNALNTGGEQFYSYVLDPTNGVAVDAVVLYEPYASGEGAELRDIFSIDGLALVMSDKVAEYSSAEYFETVLGDQPATFGVIETSDGVTTIGVYLDPSFDPNGGGLESFDGVLNWDGDDVTVDNTSFKFAAGVSGQPGVFDADAGTMILGAFALPDWAYTDPATPFMTFDLTVNGPDSGIVLGLTDTLWDDTVLVNSYDIL